MDALDQLAQKFLDQVKGSTGLLWDKLSPADKQLISEVCTDAAELQFDALAFPPDSASQKLLAERKADINAQLQNVAAAEEGVLQQALWQAAKEAAAGAIAIGIAAL